jgi:hypothetical protein
MKTQGHEGHVTVTAIDVLSSEGHAVDAIEMLQPLMIRIHYRAKRPVSNPVFVIGILTPEMWEITNFNTANVHGPDFIEGEGFVECQIQETRLLPGNYGIKCVIRDHRGLKHFRHEQAAWFRVVSPTYGPLRGNGGVVYTPTKWKFFEEGRDGSC